MAGDEIVTEWLGEAYSDTHYVTGGHDRFYATSKRLRSFRVRNISGTYNVYLGKYYSSSATFHNNALLLAPGITWEIGYIDLYTLGYGYYNGPAMIQMLGA